MKTIMSLSGSLCARNNQNNSVKSLMSGAVMMVLLAGCASKGNQANSATSEPVATEPPEATQSQAVEQSETAKASAAKADSMMASLATKSKFEQEEGQPIQAEKEEPTIKEASNEQTKPVVASVAEKETSPANVIQEKSEQKVAVSKTVKKASSKASPVAFKAKALKATRNDLPIEYGIWKIRKGEAVQDNDIVISTPTWEMGEEGYMSQIWITVMEDKLLINSSSDILAPQGKAGIKIDDSQLVPFDRVIDGNIGVVEGGEWLGKLARANELEIYMGFFPDRVPRSKIFQSNLALDKLARVAATFTKIK